MPKTALMISGGGSKGAFAVGAIEVLLERGVQFDLVTGSSTGALIAPLVATGEAQLLHRLYTSVRTEDILVLRRGLEIVSGDAIHDTMPLWRLINAHLSEARYQRVLASTTDVFVCTTNLQDGKTYYFNPKRGRDGRPLPRDTFCRAVLASASQPVLMPAVRVPDRLGDQFVDGGVREVAPLRKAIDEGAEEIYAIVLSPERSQRRSEDFVSVVDTLMRALDLLLEEVAEGDLAEAVQTNELIQYMQLVRQRAAEHLPEAVVDHLFAPTTGVSRLLARRPVKLHVIRPAEPLPGGSLEFSPAIMSEMLDLGRQAALELLA